MKKKRLAIFASGTGSNAINLIEYFTGHESIEIGFVLSNKKDAPVLESANELGAKTLYFSNHEVSQGELLIELCEKHQIDYIVLAGYLRLIPGDFIEVFSEGIINLHPSLLPNYGGKGMYGRNVHNAVLENKEKESGITIHFVNQKFDEGRIIAQFRCPISSTDKLQNLEEKIKILEQSYLPVVVEKTIMGDV
ncbi:MAG: phosphoribosylglycinamide formyltransferase [Flavobacteriales bacterium]|nr:phosphoribosylglycinamide formyltransferase [Flavobacteriales bacterium]